MTGGDESANKSKDTVKPPTRKHSISKVWYLVAAAVANPKKTMMLAVAVKTGLRSMRSPCGPSVIVPRSAPINTLLVIEAV